MAIDGRKGAAVTARDLLSAETKDLRWATGEVSCRGIEARSARLELREAILDSFEILNDVVNFNGFSYRSRK